MAARTVSELANWDGRLDQQLQNPKWRRSSSTLARDPYHIPLENQPFEIFQPLGRVSDQKRAEQSASRSNLERDSSANLPENTRLFSHGDTTLTSPHDVHHYHHPSISHNVPSLVSSPSPVIVSSKSSHFTPPNSSILASRVHNSRPSSSREHTASLQLALTTESEVIDLTIEDTEDELPVSEMLVPNSIHFTDPGPTRRPSSSRHSPPIAPERSLFTPPPPPRRRTRVFIDHIAVPVFPNGLTKADYQPMFGHPVVPLPGPTVTSTLKNSSPTEPSVTRERTPSPQKGKDREREHDSSHQKYTPCVPPNGADMALCASPDAFFEHAVIPLHEDDTYPPLTTLDLATNTRFQFAHAWRGYASRLREAERDWTLKFSLLGKACIWVQSLDTPSPRIPGTAGWVSSEQPRSWELVLPDSSPQEKSSKHIWNEQADATGGHSAVEIDANYLSLPDDALPVSTIAFGPELSNSTLSQSLSSTAVDMEHDMNQYFNGLTDSPNKHIPPRQQPAPTHTFRPHLLQSAGRAQMHPLGLGFPSLELDQLADTGDHECFLGVPPSPTTADMESSIAPVLTPDSPFESVNHFTASPSNVFTREAPPTDAWLFEQGEGLLPDNDSPPIDDVPPTALGTIDPSLLGHAQSQTPSRPPKDTPKRRSKLPEPVIYIRRPIDPSTLPLVSGKRPVQIKYRDPGGPPATPSTQSVSRQVSSNPVEHPIEMPRNDMDDLPRVKRLSAPSRKLCEYQPASEPDSDFIPESSKSKSKMKPKQPNVRDKKSVAEYQGTDAATVSTMSFCHQCRNRSERPKMLCSNMVGDRVCGKRFCNRCILHRYPDITFDEHSAGFLCPACTNTCNCSVCSRNRGEEFVSMRLGGLAAPLFKTKVTLVRDVGKPLHRVKSLRTDADARRSASEATTPTPEPGALPTQPHFWAHVYGMEGEHVGSAFMTREHLDHLQMPGPSAPPPKPQPPKKVEKPRRREKKREKTRGPRVFVGRPLESWKVRAVRDLEPSVDVETIWGKGKSKGSSGDNHVLVPAPGSSRRSRCYVGNPAPLYEPYGRMSGTTSPTPASPSRCSTPVLDSDGSLAPLSEFEADCWPQPEVGECCSWAPPPPPPGTIVHGFSSGPSGLSGPFARERFGPGIPAGAVGAGADIVGQQGVSLGSSSGSGVDVDERGSASTALSEEDMARAISAALAALSVELPS